MQSWTHRYTTFILVNPSKSDFCLNPYTIPTRTLFTYQYISKHQPFPHIKSVKTRNVLLTDTIQYLRYFLRTTPSSPELYISILPDRTLFYLPIPFRQELSLHINVIQNLRSFYILAPMRYRPVPVLHFQTSTLSESKPQPFSIYRCRSHLHLFLNTNMLSDICLHKYLYTL